ncbi:MAG TPA: serine/threonine-protein kinase [Gaiellales bacterium]|jgi:serine/threonine-protein kinase|nr:serine/threonine-protein kinase [Gaiellales bacterium]
MPEAARQQGPALFPSGVVCDRFRIDGVLGVGGTGTVFRALDLERAEVVALKAIPHDATLRQRARREASVAGKLRHPNVVRLRSVHEDGQYVYIASDIVEGVDLAGALRQGQLGDASLLRVASAVCSGLAHAHEHGVVHRDVKPANVLLGRDGSVRVLDFGIATLDEPDATVDDRMLGTLSYMAPETCQGGRPKPATDVWAVGVMVYEALTGANPYRARTPDELRERHRHPPRSLGDLRPDLPHALAAACARALESHPRRRPSAEAFGRVLAAAADAIERPGERGREPSTGGGRRLPLGLLSRPGRVSLPSLPSLLDFPRPQVSLPVAEWGESVARCGLPELGEGPRRIARLAAGSGCCALLIASVLGAFPFWPSGLVLPLAFAGALLALASPWLAGAFALAVCVPALGDVSAGLAWCVALAGGLWLLACVRAGRRALLPAAAPLLAAVLLWPLYVLAAGSLRTVLGRALAGAAGPFAIALWAAVPLAGGLAGTADAGGVARTLVAGAGAPLLVQSAAWALAAAVVPYVLASVRRGVLIGVWLAGLLAGQVALPALAGAAPESAVRSAVAIWAVAILLALGVRAPDGDAPAGTPLPAEE